MHWYLTACSPHMQIHFKRGASVYLSCVMNANEDRWCGPYLFLLTVFLGHLD